MVKKINSEPPIWGEYGSAAAYYASDEWRELATLSLANHRIQLGLARRAENAEAIKAFSYQVKAFEKILGLSAEKEQAANPAQASLFNSLLGIK